MIVFIPIEVKIREFFSKTFLAYHIIKNGDDVILGSQRDMPVNISKMKNCYWLDKNIFFKKVNKNKDMRYIQKNHLGMIDEEGPVSFFENITSEMRYPKNLINYYDTFLFWGNNDFNSINSKFKNSKKNLVIGHPKYDILKKPFVNIWKSKVDEIKKNYGDYILFNSSFKLRPNKADNRKNIIIARENVRNKNNFKKAIIRREQVYNIEDKNYKQAIQLLKDLAYQNPKKNFIYRPHPSENIKITKKNFGEIPKNLFIIFRDEATPWIIGAELFIHSGCTTIFEAAILKKKTICFLPYGQSHRYKIYSKIGFFFKNKQNCIKFINKYLKKKNNNLKLGYVKKIIKNFNDKNSFFKEFIKHIKNTNIGHLESEIEFGERLFGINLFFYRMKQYFFKILSFIKDYFVVNTPLIYILNQKYINSKKSSDKKLKSIKKIEIREIFESIQKCENTIFNYSIKKISSNVFKISKLND